MRTPQEAGYQQPAEWARHEAVWLAWPSHEELWEDALPDAQREFVGLCDGIADPDPATGQPRGERLEILVRTEQDERDAKAALGHLGARFHRELYGDIWLRDTAPVFLHDKGRGLGSVRFVFNGWGGKYDLPGDSDLASRIQRIVHGSAAGGAPAFALDFVCEGGAIEVDGEGTVLTTEQCMLNPNRNPSLSREQIETVLCDALGVRRVLWVARGLQNDHTDGHIDTLARFVAPGVVVCMAPSGDDDPNAAVLEAIARELAWMVDAKGRKLQVVRMPSPGRVLDADGEIMPASYANFYVGNTSVVVPTYDTPWDEAAVSALEPYFPEHRVVGRACKTILEGGGAFHCITQQQPERA